MFCSLSLTFLDVGFAARHFREQALGDPTRGGLVAQGEVGHRLDGEVVDDEDAELARKLVEQHARARRLGRRSIRGRRGESLERQAGVHVDGSPPTLAQDVVGARSHGAGRGPCRRSRRHGGGGP